MKTYQDFEKATDKIAFLSAAIADHKVSAAYRVAVDAEDYDRHLNPTIRRYQKTLYNMAGQEVIDNYTANYKIASNFFAVIITQLNQYLLGNGIVLQDEASKAALGADFDISLQRLGRAALVAGVAFGFWTGSRLHVFRLTEFVPLYDEETGALRAGIRFWQLDVNRPMRITLYEQDGYTEYRRANGDTKEIEPKRPYIQTVRESEADGVEIVAGSNFPGLPIIPLYGNPNHQSELVGLREHIDCYDLIKSGFANDLDDAAMFYWTITNAGGMTDVDFAKFVEHMKLHKAAGVEDDARIEAHTIEVPYESRVAYLEKLRSDIYADAQVLDITQISSGNRTATEINAAYQPMDSKADQYEYCVLDFLSRLFAVIGLEDTPSFRRSRIVNQLEETQMVLLAAQYLDEETVLNLLPFVSPDQVQEILARKDAEALARFDE